MNKALPFISDWLLGLNQVINNWIINENLAWQTSIMITCSCTLIELNTPSYDPGVEQVIIAHYEEMYSKNITYLPFKQQQVASTSLCQVYWVWFKLG